MNTPEAFQAARNGLRMRRANWPSGKVLVYDFEPNQGFTIRDEIGWIATVEPDAAPYKEDWQEYRTQ